MVYLLLALNIIFLVVGQFLWKTAVAGVQSWNSSSFVSVLFSSPFIGGAALYVVATGLWLMILSKLPLHIAYPLQSLCYVLATIISFCVFKENVTLSQWVGIVVVMFGVFLIAK